VVDLPLETFERLCHLIEAGGPEQQQQLLVLIATRYDVGRYGPRRRARVRWQDLERAFEEHGPMTAVEVAQLLPYESRRTATNAVQELRYRGRLQRVGKGLYDVPRRGRK
jgi:hypothetical protein